MPSSAPAGIVPPESNLRVNDIVRDGTPANESAGAQHTQLSFSADAKTRLPSASRHRGKHASLESRTHALKLAHAGSIMINSNRRIFFMLHRFYLGRLTGAIILVGIFIGGSVLFLAWIIGLFY